MALTDTFVRNTKHSGRPAGDKHADGGGMYLLVNAGGKYWRMDYRFADKRKTLALGVYPAVSLAKARQRRDKAREHLAEGIDPSTAKREERKAKADAAANSFESVARDWLAKTAAKRADITQLKVKTWLEKDVFRAMARTIMDEVLGERVDLIEHQLAHAVKDANGRTYNRTAHLPARREMMQRWADYLDKLRVGADVIPLRSTS